MSNKFEALKASDDIGEDDLRSAENRKNEKDALFLKDKYVKYKPFVGVYSALHNQSNPRPNRTFIEQVGEYLQPPLEINPNEHKLQYAYALWYSRRNPGKQSNIQSYDQNLKLIGRFASVEQFWELYSHLIRPSELMTHTDFHLFKVGIKPMWEDEANQRGGKWIVRLRKGLVSRCWENLILAMLGEQFMVGEEICGAVVSIRFQEDIICVWNKSASDVATTTRIRDTLKRVLHLPASASMEYKTHNDSLKNLMRL